MKDLSIIIVNYNTRKLLVECLESIINSKLKARHEIVVVDNGSTDGSLGAIRKFKKQNQKAALRLIQNRENFGFSKASNQGLEVAQGRYILLLNSDTVVKKGALDKLIDFGKKNPDAGVVGARLLNTNGSIQKSCFNFPSIKRAIKQYWLNQGKPLDKFAPSGRVPVQVDAIVGAAFLITPQALKKVGKLDERYFFFYEDLDYCRRVRKAGFKVYYLPSAEIVHYHGSSGEGLAKKDSQWRRLIPGSKIYHGATKHYLFNFILWSGQKWQNLLRK